MGKIVENELNRALKPHLLYLVILEGNDELFCKIGVTSNDVETRFKDDKYNVISSRVIKFKDGVSARGVESLLLERILNYDTKYRPLQTFGGYSECYEANAYRDISLILQTIVNHDVYKVEEKLPTLKLPALKLIPINNFSYLGLDYQVRLISQILLDNDFGRYIVDRLKTTYFDNEWLRIIFHIIEEYYDDNDVIIDIDSIVLILDLTDEITIGFIKTQIEQIKKANLKDARKIQNIAAKFCKRQQLLKIIDEAQILLDGDLDNVIDADDLMSSTFIDGTRYFEEKGTTVNGFIGELTKPLSELDIVLKHNKQGGESLGTIPTLTGEGKIKAQERVNFMLNALEESKAKEEKKGQYRKTKVVKISETVEQRFYLGDERWFKNNVLHRDGDLPAVIYATGDKEWYKNGKQHRGADLPSSIKVSGEKRWYKNGIRHRKKGPAIIFSKGAEHFYIDGERVKK